MTDILDKTPKAKGNASDRSSKTLVDIPAVSYTHLTLPTTCSV